MKTIKNRTVPLFRCSNVVRAARSKILAAFFHKYSILIFPFIWGLNGILYAQPIADVLSALITVFMAIPLHRSLAVAEQKMKITASIPCDRQ